MGVLRFPSLPIYRTVSHFIPISALETTEKAHIP